ncbi:MAG TPA: hypothetical protein VF608_09990 [Thermoanaerobaculia bacterium]
MDFREHESDFTEAHYAELLRLAKRRYRFARFTDPHTDGDILWRHDIDMSPHRARALARIEAAEGVATTYLVMLHSRFYNALDGEVASVIRDIASLGHSIGLHFDPAFYAGRPDLDEFVALEKQMLERALEVRVDVLSWHNPSIGNWLTLDEDRIVGMVNAYGKTIRDTFPYVSDSHGIWRFRRLHDVLAAGEEPRLHVLTHAEWWVPDAMPPRARISRAIEGRAAQVQRWYDDDLAALGRPNVR